MTPLAHRPPRGFKSDILADACSRAGISLPAARGRSQVRETCIKRWRLMKILREEHKWSFPQIGRALNKDHTSVLTALRRLPDVEAAISSGTYHKRRESAREVALRQAKDTRPTPVDDEHERGVGIDRGKWRARICRGGVDEHLGYYSEKADAVNARRNAEAKYGYNPVTNRYANV